MLKAHGEESYSLCDWGQWSDSLLGYDLSAPPSRGGFGENDLHSSFV